jgi:hypothetical protein
MNRVAPRVGALPAVILALLAMVVALLETAHTPPFRDPMEMGYVDFTRRIAAGEGMSTRLLAPYYPAKMPSPISFWPPLYPGAAAAVTKLGVPAPEATKLVSIAAFGLTVALVWVLGSAVFDRSVGTITALLLAVWPPVARTAGMALSENLFVLFVVLCAVITVRLLRPQPTTARVLLIAALGGLAMGAASLTRYAALALIPIGAVGLIVNLQGRALRERLAVTAVWSVCAAIPPVAFLIRNVVVTGSLIGAGRPPDERGLVYHAAYAVKTIAADALELLSRVLVLPEMANVDRRAVILLVLAGGGVLLYGLLRSDRVRAGVRAALASSIGTAERRFLIMLWAGFWAGMLVAHLVMGFMSLSTRMLMPGYPLALVSVSGAVAVFVSIVAAPARRALPWVVAVLCVAVVAGVVLPRAMAAGGPRLHPDDPPVWVKWVAANTPPGAPIVGNGGFDYTFYLDRPVVSFASFLEYRGGDRFDRDCRRIASTLTTLGWEHPYLILRAEDGGLDPQAMGRRYGRTIEKLLRGEPSLPVRELARFPEFIAYEVLSVSWSCGQE